MCFCKSLINTIYKEERVDNRVWAPDSQQNNQEDQFLYTILFKFFLFPKLFEVALNITAENQ